jgi:hypothetical protein
MPLLRWCNGVSLSAAGLWAPTVSSVTLAGGGADVLITTSAAHGLSSGTSVVVAGTTGVTGLNATWTVTVASATTFRLNNSSALTGTPSGSPTVALANLDISGVTGANPVLRVVVESMTDAKGVVIGVEDSVDAFSGTVARYTFSVKGPIAQPTELTISGKDFPMNRMGVASAVLRARVVAIDSAATVKFSVFVDH